MSLNRRTFAKLIGGVSMLGVAGLAPSILRAQEGQARRGGTLLFGVESEPTTFNGQINGLAKARVVLRNMFEPLFARTQDGGLAPWLAGSYEIEDDGRVYVFTLREGIRFSDGLPLDAEAAALKLEKIRDAAYAPTLGGGLIARLEKVEALDAQRFRLTLDGVFAPSLGAVSAVELISPAAFDSPELKAGGKSVAGTGPFILDTYMRAQEARLVRNPDYAWAPEGALQEGPALLDEVVFRFLPESSVRIARCSPVRSTSSKAFRATTRPSSETTRPSPTSAVLTPARPTRSSSTWNPGRPPTSPSERRWGRRCWLGGERTSGSSASGAVRV